MKLLKVEIIKIELPGNQEGGVCYFCTTENDNTFFLRKKS